MQVIIHRGTHQIGGVATEIRTASTRILIDMGEELGTEDGFAPTPLNIAGVTDSNGSCDAVLFTHYHGDHVGRLMSIREAIPVYMGSLTRDILLAATAEKDTAMKRRLSQASCFAQGVPLKIGDMRITPFSVDHSACDSYMFLIEAEGKRILHTGDFRMHGFRGKAVPKILEKLVGHVDALIIEGTALSRADTQPVTERELQQQVEEYLEKYKYVFVLCASTNLERICAMSKAVKRGRYFVCDKRQKVLLEQIEKHGGQYSELYRNIKLTTYGDNLLPRLREKGFLMTVRDNPLFRRVIPLFDPKESIILYSMWDGYRTKKGSSIPAFLSLSGRWEPLHTSGHASAGDIKTAVDLVTPNMLIPIHTEAPEALKALCPERRVVILKDGEVLEI